METIGDGIEVINIIEIASVGTNNGRRKNGVGRTNTKTQGGFIVHVRFLILAALLRALGVAQK